MLSGGDGLVLEDGRHVVIAAAVEDLLEIVAHNPLHLCELAWHIGNRHLPAQIEAQRILIRRDRIICHMLETLGATVTDVSEPFHPEHGAYHSHGH